MDRIVIVEVNHFAPGWRQGVAAAAICAALLASGAHAETIGGALIKAYTNNPDINQQRAPVRVSDENIPRANAGNLPERLGRRRRRRFGTLSHRSRTGRSRVEQVGHETSNTAPRGYGLTVTAERLERQPQRSIRSGRPNPACSARARQLRNTEQNVLLSSVTAYMDVMRDSAILDLDRNNVEVLQEQLRQTQDRFNVGELTRTDVAQAQASLGGRARHRARLRNRSLEASLARYRQFIGEEPKSLSPVGPISEA